MNRIIIFLIVLLLSNTSYAITAEEIFSSVKTPEEIGEIIAHEADERDFGFIDSTSEIKMILENAAGERSIREMRQKVLENPNPKDGDKSEVIFDKPRDVKGTALLSYAHFFQSDDQWLYLPALKRIKRISSKNKSGPFMGSEFSYEDFTSTEMAKYKYKYIKDDKCGKYSCFKVERYPLYENSGYTRQVMWIDKGEFIARKIDFYDRKNALLKTLTFSGYHKLLDKFWRAQDMYMVNHQTGKRTMLTTNNIRFKTGLSEIDFKKSALKRFR